MTQHFDSILNLDEVSKIVGKNKRTLWRWWAKDKTMPEPLKVRGRAIGWRQSTLDAWLDQLGDM
ncbi:MULTISPECIES: helix-turn-helix transcriptional regulator [Vibrio]|uniref:helix-turn-helix transcriptional regulator n=1 Tax=Vibrio TaxID=662 RepID=UPI000C172C9B|nr:MULTISPECIES: AlpA family phage regulatory protein [Vibrio]MDA3137371.1 AlpA family phage regulatory protein [Vibrio metschnikovii]